jgi:hypothetical protein
LSSACLIILVDGRRLSRAGGHRECKRTNDDGLPAYR